MKKYSPSEIKEFAKMGYHIDEYGNMLKITKLQKIVNQKEGENKLKELNVDSKTYKTKECGNKKSYTVSFRQNVDEDDIKTRQQRGLVIPKQVGVDYLAISNEKVCRCCQQKKTKNSFANQTASPDGKVSICRECKSKHDKYLYNRKKLSKK